MKIAIATVQVPFITGGAELHAKMLKDELAKRGHQAEIVTIPFKWYPPETVVDCMMMGRMMDLSEVNGEKIDKVIALKFPAFYVKHKHKVLWLEHQHRQAYDLWGTPYGDIDKMEKGEALRKLIIESDKKYIREAEHIYVIAKNTARRLEKYNGIMSEVLYHPPLHYDRFYCEGYSDYIFYASRIDPMKRQRVLAEAMKYTKTKAKAVIAGTGSRREIEYIEAVIKKNHLERKVILTGFLSEEEKISYYANCLGVYFGAYDEDYGYITLESFFSKKPVIVHYDAGGPLEFVEDQVNGYVTEEDPKKVAALIDAWYQNREAAKRMGENGFRLMQEKHIDWDYVIQKLLQ
jgi:glycosyltransferase involved in cell wall biosynthesis